MKVSTLEAWQVYSARCARLDREEAARRPLPLWVRLSAHVEVLGLLAAVELVALCWAVGLL